uniref:Putative secreted protein n=1 Tax=Ixodes ricinus TaxID=34613 RepID=A0A6B0UFN4_IXORI
MAMMSAIVLLSRSVNTLVCRRYAGVLRWRLWLSRTIPRVSCAKKQRPTDCNQYFGSTMPEDDDLDEELGCFHSGPQRQRFCHGVPCEIIGRDHYPPASLRRW